MHAHDCSLSDTRAAGFYDGADFDGHVVAEGDAAAGLVAIRGADVRPLMDDAAPADQDATARRLELRAGMDDGL